MKPTFVAVTQCFFKTHQITSVKYPNDIMSEIYVLTWRFLGLTFSYGECSSKKPIKNHSVTIFLNY